MFAGTHLPAHTSTLLSVWPVFTLQSICRQRAKQGLQSWAVTAPCDRRSEVKTPQKQEGGDNFKTGLKDKLKWRCVDDWALWMWPRAHPSLCVSVTRNFGPPPTSSSWTWRSATSSWQSRSHPSSLLTPFTRGGFLVKQVFYSSLLNLYNLV